MANWDDIRSAGETTKVTLVTILENNEFISIFIPNKHHSFLLECMFLFFSINNWNYIENNILRNKKPRFWPGV